MITHQAGRLNRVESPTMADMRTLQPADLPAVRS
jgi:hypothetical protein